LQSLGILSPKILKELVFMEEKLAISYCRKSTHDKERSEADNIAYQQLKIDEYAERRGLKIIKNFSDVGYSGVNLNRPGIQELLDYLYTTSEQIDELIIYSTCRLGRDLENNIKVLQKVVEKVSRVYFIQDNQSTDDPVFRMIFLMMTGVAQDSRERLLKGLADGRTAKIIKNKTFNGRYIPLGYVKGANKRLVEANDLNTFDLQKRIDLEILETICYLYLFNYSLRKIALVLNEKYGLTNRGKLWSYKSVQYILKNEIYIGVLKGKLNGNQHYYLENANVTKLIDPLIFMLIQKKMENESAGRKKDIVRYHNFNLCYDCCRILNINDHFFYCNSCSKKIATTLVEKLIEEKLVDFLESRVDVLTNSVFLSKLKERYSINCSKLLQLKEALISRGKQIEKLEINFVSKNRMIEANTEEIKNIQQEYVNYNLLIECINNGFDNKKKVLPTSNYLVSLPYLVIINFKKKEINVVFHKELLVNEDENNVG
jgi:DNA invertase Pin-like site-specific DNA recombinase